MNDEADDIDPARAARVYLVACPFCGFLRLFSASLISIDDLAGEFRPPPDEG